MKKIFIFTLISFQIAIVPSWSMGRKMKEPNANQGQEQNQAGQSSVTKLNDSGNLDASSQTFKDQDRDTMNSTTGFPGQTNPAENIESDVDLKNQTNPSGSTGQKGVGVSTSNEKSGSLSGQSSSGKMSSY